jgi:hypothetical protein
MDGVGIAIVAGRVLTVISCREIPRTSASRVLPVVNGTGQRGQMGVQGIWIRQIWRGRLPSFNARSMKWRALSTCVQMCARIAGG